MRAYHPCNRLCKQKYVFLVPFVILLVEATSKFRLELSIVLLCVILAVYITTFIYIGIKLKEVWVAVVVIVDTILSVSSFVIIIGLSFVKE